LSDYYARQAATHLDGSPIFKTADDERNERDVAAVVEAVWRCELHSFGRLSPVDWYATRAGRLVGVLELKSRTHPHDRYGTVFLNVRKWLALVLAATGLGCPAVFAVKFTDHTRWIDVADVDIRNARIGGCRTVVKARSDVEPVIEVPVSAMRPLTADARKDQAS
jgi:hypothetical protein